MRISTMNDVPVHEVATVLGGVFGLTVRARHTGSRFGSASKSVKGGDLEGRTVVILEPLG